MAASVQQGAPASAPPSPRSARRGHRPDVQGLRALAVLLVVLFHTDLVLPGGFVGVDVFFVISGFVIAGTLGRELDGSGRIRLADFSARRARRLLPALALLLAVGLVLSVLVLSPLGAQQVAAKTALAASALGSNLYLYAGLDSYFAPEAATNPFLHVWSLSLEEQLYLVLPISIVLAERVRRRVAPTRTARHAAVAVVVVLTVPSLALSASMALGGNPFGVADPRAFAFYLLPTRLWEFGAGALLALALPHLRLARRGIAFALGIVGLVLVLVAAVTFSDTTRFPGVAALLPVGGTLALIVAGTAATPLGTVLSTRAAVWVGDRSYAWYLWHWPLIVFARLTWPDAEGLVVCLAAAGSLVPAALSYRFVEQRWRFRRDLVGERAIALAAVCLLVPAVLAAFVISRADQEAVGLRVTDPAGEQVVIPDVAGLQARTVASADGCMGREGDPLTWPADTCTYGPPIEQSEGRVLLLGDSHAVGFSDVVTEAATQLDLTTSVWSRASCAFVSPGEFGPDPDCPQWQEAALDLVDELQPDVVVIGMKTEGIGAEFLRERFGATLDALAERGTPVVVIAPGPIFPTSPADQGGLLSGVDVLPTLTLDEVAEQRGEVLALEEQLTAEHEGMVVVDPVPLVCADVCSQAADGEWLFFDQNHLTPIATMRLLGPLVEAIEQVQR